MFQYTVVKDLCGGSIIKGRVSGELFLLFQECEDVVIPLPLGERSLEQENLGRFFEILCSKEVDVRKRDLEQKRAFFLRWKGNLLIFVYQEIFIPAYGGIESSELKCAFLIC
jgi:hypothetical protein